MLDRGTSVGVKVKSSRQPRAEANLAITSDAFPREGMLKLIDNCIAPALVEHFLQSRLKLPAPIKHAHNVDQP